MLEDSSQNFITGAEPAACPWAHLLHPFYEFVYRCHTTRVRGTARCFPCSKLVFILRFPSFFTIPAGSGICPLLGLYHEHCVYSFGLLHVGHLYPLFSPLQAAGAKDAHRFALCISVNRYLPYPSSRAVVVVTFVHSF